MTLLHRDLILTGKLRIEKVTSHTKESRMLYKTKKINPFLVSVRDFCSIELSNKTAYKLPKSKS